MVIITLSALQTIFIDRMKKFDQIFEKLKVLSKLQLFIMRSIADKFLCIILKEILSTQLLIRSYYLQRRTMSNCNFFERVRYIDNSIFRMIKIQATTFFNFPVGKNVGSYVYVKCVSMWKHFCMIKNKRSYLRSINSCVKLGYN